jgi:hypothetical protein
MPPLVHTYLWALIDLKDESAIAGGDRLAVMFFVTVENPDAFRPAGYGVWMIRNARASVAFSSGSCAGDIHGTGVTARVDADFLNGGYRFISPLGLEETAGEGAHPASVIAQFQAREDHAAVEVLKDELLAAIHPVLPLLRAADLVPDGLVQP